MRYAILTDIHGNSIGLDAVLRAIDDVHHPAPDYIRTFYRGEYFPT